MPRLTFVAALLMGIFLAAPAMAQTAGCPVDPPGDPVPTGLQEALTEINALRRQHGVAPLAIDARLNRAAQLHAEDMARFRYFSHRSRDGRRAGDRIRAQGYNWRGWGENIAMGQHSWSQAIQGWMRSPGHRRNMLNPNWKHLGLGVQDRRWVQVFAIPR